MLSDAAGPEDADALLGGRLVDHLVELGRPIPARAALNRLAHVTFRELVDVVAGRAGARCRTGWAAAERVLAFELVTRGWDAEGVHCAQMDVLVPLELALVDLAEPEVTGAGRRWSMPHSAVGTPLGRRQ